jgi:uncharacterized protein YaiI (UPF0178 family)
MRIWVDADAIPGAAKELVLRAAEKRAVPAAFVSDRFVTLPRSPLFSWLPVVAGPDAADHRIAAEAAPGDLCVTQDIPLAAALVAKGVAAIDPRGTVHTASSVGERKSIRDFMEDLRGAGVSTGGPPPYGPRDRQRFADALDRELTRLSKGR